MSKPKSSNTVAARAAVAERRTAYTPVVEATAAKDAAHAAAIHGIGQPGNDEQWAAFKTALLAWADATRAYVESPKG